MSLRNKRVFGQKPRRIRVLENPFSDLRRTAFMVTPDQLNVRLDKDKTEIFGVIMDWDVGQVIAIVVSFQTGEASLCLSSGKIYMGGFANKTIASAAKQLVDESNAYLSKSQRVESNSLPDKNCVKFHFLTNKGIFTHQETVLAIESGKNEWTKLFQLGNRVVTEYRLKDKD